MSEKTDKKITTEISLLYYTENYARLPNSMLPYRCKATAVDTQHTLCINSVQTVFIDKDKFI